MKPFLAALLCSFVCCVSPLVAQEPLVDRVKSSIDKSIRHLRELAGTNGDFESAGGVLARLRPGGVTALAVVALINAGVETDDPLIQSCLKYLRTVEPRQSYTVGLQTMAFCLAGEKQDRQLVQRNLQWIVDNRLNGGWPYDASTRAIGPDHSINQYILLGVHEARLAGFEIDKVLLKDMYALYNPNNHPGQWGYRSNRSPTLTMTTAGLCNLLITGEDLAEARKLDDDGSDPNCGLYSDASTVARALEYLGAVYPNDIRQVRDRGIGTSFPHAFYCLYGVERAGRLTGRRFFNDKDWYRIGCEYLTAVQNPNGSWEGADRDFDRVPVVATSLSLLFLSKGRTPVLISKLAHGVVTNPDRMEEWNRKRGDVRHVVDFCSRELFEGKALGWQVFDARQINKTSEELAEELLQTPVVYINGHTLTQIVGQKAEGMLREYLNNGGFIFAEACCNSKTFDRQFRDMIKKVTGSDLGPLPSNHEVWGASGKFKVDWREFPLEGLQQGCKTVVIYSPVALAGHWENNDTKSDRGKKSFWLAANVIAYATGLQMPKPRLTQMEIVKESTAPKPPRGYLQVAQLVSSAQAQPLAPKAIPNLMAEIGKYRLDVHQTARKLTPTDERVLDYKFFYMHDRNGFAVPSANQLENLQFTLENGGLLFADAACGSKSFDKAFRQMVKVMFPDRKLEPIALKPNQERNELFSKQLNFDDRGKGFTLETVRCRREDKDGNASKEFQQGPPRLEGIKINDRWVVIYSPYDIGCALEKHQSTECLGHDYDSARTLAKAIILYALRR